MDKRSVVSMIAVMVWWLSGLGALPYLQAQESSNQVREHLQHRLTDTGSLSVIMVGDTRLQTVDLLTQFYKQRAYQPAWVQDNTLLPPVFSLIKVLSEADRDGLWPDDYDVQSMEALIAEIGQHQEQHHLLPLDRLVDLELLLTNAFLLYGSHAWTGRFNLKMVHKDWHLERQEEKDLVALLQNALAANSITESLHSLFPSHPVYIGLRQALLHYRDLATKGGWPLVPDGPKLQKGDRHTRVAVLRARLLVSGDLRPPEAPTDMNLFDEVLEQAVRTFQQRHGLEVDGVVGVATLAALNVPVEERVHQIALNMERWRWIPRDLGQRYILVNIANFALEVVEDGQPVITMRTIIGRPDRPTPIFHAQMSYLVISPHWYVPPRIAIQDKLPLIRKDPGYFTKQRIRVFQGEGEEKQEVDPSTIDWSTVTAETFAYHLRQDPSPINALGRIKFMFPNRFNVYLHDTPSRKLFTRAARAFSSGCIRIEKPLDLAEYLLRNNPNWTREKIRAAMEQGIERVVNLPETLLIYLLYWTAWVESDGTVHFRKDLYESDKALDTILHKAASVAA